MGYRQNKDTQWTGTLSYNFTRPIHPKKGVAKTLKVALLLLNESPKTREEILLRIGVAAKVAAKKGQYSCIFTALNWNQVILYDKTKRAYIQGERFKEFMAFTLQLIASDPTIKKKHKKEYHQVLKATSNALHFILT